MTTETTKQEDARKIWDQLDAEERGDAMPQSSDDGDAGNTGATAQAAAQNSGNTEPSAEELSPADLIKKIASLESTLGQLSGRVRNAEGHIGGLNSAVKQQVETARQVKESGAAAPNAAEISAAQSSPEAFASLEREYPEFAKAMKPAVDAVVAAQMAEFRKNLPTQQSGEPSISRADLETFKAEQKIESRHPGWESKVATDEFRGWLGGAPYEVQMLAHSKSPEHAIRLIDLFDQSKKPVGGESRPQRHTSAAALPTGTRSAVRTKNVDEMSPQEYWRHLDQLEQQQKA